LLHKNIRFKLLRFIIVCLFLLQVIFAYALTSTTHTVRKGDNLYRLAKTYGVSVEAIQKANHMSGTSLNIGQKLKIPTNKKQEASKKKKSIITPKTPTKPDSVTTPKKKLKGSFPDFRSMEKSKPGLAEELLQKTRELMGEKPSQTQAEPEQVVPEVPAIVTTNILPIPKDGYHVVKAKEGLFRISKMYGLDMKEIMALNNMQNYSIKKGQKLKLVSDEKLKLLQENEKQQKEEETAAKNSDENRIPEKIKVEKDSLELVEAIHVVQRHETLFSISKKYSIPVDDLKKLNNLSTTKIFVGQKIYLKLKSKKQPVPELKQEEVTVPELKDPSRIRNDLIKPVEGHIISNFGLRQNRPHKGLDIGAPSGTPIYAALEGMVVYSGMQSGYGNVIVIEHPDFVMTVYAHNERNLVSVGDYVEKGQQIAVVGSTGNATASHLHFEYRVKGKAIDPKKVLPEY